MMTAKVKCTETKFLSLNDFDSFIAWFDYYIYLDVSTEIRNQHSFCFDWYDLVAALGENFEFPAEGKDYILDYEIDTEKQKIKLTGLKELNDII